MCGLGLISVLGLLSFHQA